MSAWRGIAKVCHDYTAAKVLTLIASFGLNMRETRTWVCASHSNGSREKTDWSTITSVDSDEIMTAAVESSILARLAASDARVPCILPLAMQQTATLTSIKCFSFISGRRASSVLPALDKKDWIKIKPCPVQR